MIQIAQVEFGIFHDGDEADEDWSAGSSGVKANATGAKGVRVLVATDVGK